MRCGADIPSQCLYAWAYAAVSVVYIYFAGKELSLGLSLDRPGNLITNPTLPLKPAPKASRKHGFV